ncbi:hypothetical protein OIU79_023799 [Salix purpurea]|uniref:Uncharacterized protein n=1 Tax=Salix purpurea TaxID=77065 RepID=A0A9Q0W9I7_SALPP|nr:hypothetical protein OIU79_023799 [Salix purpurea]
MLVSNEQCLRRDTLVIATFFIKKNVLVHDESEKIDCICQKIVILIRLIVYAHVPCVCSLTLSMNLTKSFLLVFNGTLP